MIGLQYLLSVKYLLEHKALHTLSSISSPPDNTHFSSHVKESSEAWSPKLRKCFNGTAVFISLTVPSAATLPIRFVLYLNDELPVVFAFALLSISYLLSWHKLPEVSEYFSLYSIEFYLCIPV